jgi:hypothetical protein
LKNYSSSTLQLIFAIIAFSTFTSTGYAAPPSSAGSLGIRIAQIPAAVADEPFADVYIISRLQPTISLSQRLEVFNTSKQEFKVSVYPGAASFVKEKFTVADGRMGNTLTSWIKLTPNLLVVKPGESKTFIMTISTPANAASENQFGVIWAEVQGAPNASGVTSISRVGIRMYIPVGNSLPISIAVPSSESNSKQIIVTKSTHGLIQVIYLLSILNILFFIFFLRCFLKKSSERKARAYDDKRDASEYRKGLKRRNKKSKRKEP